MTAMERLRTAAEGMDHWVTCGYHEDESCNCPLGELMAAVEALEQEKTYINSFVAELIEIRHVLGLPDDDPAKPSIAALVRRRIAELESRLASTEKERDAFSKTCSDYALMIGRQEVTNQELESQVNALMAAMGCIK